jgi:predicted DNA-binding protein (MmcQ/YjbR family)
MPKADNVLERVREICLSLPDTKETPTWGKPHFRVGDKIFAGCGEENGILSIGFKLHMEHAVDIVVHDRRFSRAPYVGHKGWVSLDASNGVRDWDEVRELIIESYELIAPKRTLAKLAATGSPSAKPTIRKTGSVPRSTAPKRRTAKVTASKSAPAARRTARTATTRRKPATTPRPAARTARKKATERSSTK